MIIINMVKKIVQRRIVNPDFADQDRGVRSVEDSIANDFAPATINELREFQRSVINAKNTRT